MEQNIFNTVLRTGDWRMSAAILGLIRFLDFFDIEYNKYEIDNKIDLDELKFNCEEITEARYTEFIETQYKDEMHHLIIEDILLNDSLSEEQIKLVNEKMIANTVLKKTFNKIKCSEENKETILQLINENRAEIVKETFKYKPKLYRNFCNENMFLKEETNCCRIKGYSFDFGKKSKSNSYNFNSSTYVGCDSIYYDFIPFAFSIGFDSFFINDNCSIIDLKKTYDYISREQIDAKNNNIGNSKAYEAKRVLFQTIISSSEFVDFDVEVIKKNTNNDFFESIFLRKESIAILKSIKDYSAFCFSIKLSKDYYVSIFDEVVYSIINMVHLDGLIEMLLKQDNKIEGHYKYVIEMLIKLNIKLRNGNKIYEGSVGMEKKILRAKIEGDELVWKSNMEENKLKSFRNKLTSALVFKDYDRYCEVLLNLANYTNKQFSFAYDLFEDFEQNKDVAYAFVNALAKGYKNKESDNSTSENVREDK